MDPVNSEEPALLPQDILLPVEVVLPPVVNKCIQSISLATF